MYLQVHFIQPTIQVLKRLMELIPTRMLTMGGQAQDSNQLANILRFIWVQL